jgi:hypothetical protein
MSATGADPQSDRTRLRRESRTWRLIRRTLPFCRSIGSSFYLISVALIASWTIAVFFGVSLFFLVPGSANLKSGLSPGGASFDASSAETPWLMQSTRSLDRLSRAPPPEAPKPMGDAAADKGRPVVVPGNPVTRNLNPLPAPAQANNAHTIDEPPEPAPGLNRGQALTVELGTISAATADAAPMVAPQGQLSTAPEPRGASQPSHSPASRKPLQRRSSNTRTAQPHAPVSAIQDVLQKHPRVLR